MYRTVVLFLCSATVTIGCASDVADSGGQGLDDAGAGTGGLVSYATGGATFNTGGLLASTGGNPSVHTGGAASSTGGTTGGTTSTGGTASGGAGTGGAACIFPFCPVTGGTTGAGGAGGMMSTGGAAGAASCDNAVCFDVFDCVLWHPDLGHCAFTKCEAFVCKP
jgi:hypothetical protein